MKKQKIIGMALLLFWMIVIFYYSAQPAAESSELSEGVVAGLQKMGKDIFILERLLSWEELETFVRKTAHVMEYAILGGLVFFNIKNWLINKKNTFYLFLGTTICALYAASDELHQYFVPGRSCQLSDVLLDTIGAFGGSCIILVIIVSFQNHQKVKKTEKNKNYS